MLRRLTVSGVAAGMLLSAACADALRLEPPGGGGGDSSTGAGDVGGAGGDAPVPCISNSDCPEPTSVCDDIKGICVECLVLADCAHMPGTVCDQGACACPGDASWCAPGVCADLLTSPEHCGGCDRPCFGECAMGSCADPWVPVSMIDAPAPRGRHVAVWTGTHMFVWGGALDTGTANNLADGALYDPESYSWSKVTPVGAPTPRQRHTAVWTGEKVIIWGGQDGALYLDDGAMFDPATHTWTAISTVNAPSPRVFHTAVWTGSQMIIFGGQDETGEQLASGGRYDPVSDTWSATASMPAPGESRMRHTAVWDGSRMQIYGGFGDVGATLNVFLPDAGAPGGRAYDPGLNAWNDVTTAGEPSARDRHSAVHDGTRMLVFGGADSTGELASGHKLEAAAWTAFSGGPAPSARREHTAVWLEGPARMVVWGGIGAGGALATGALFASSTNTWTAATPTALPGRHGHTAVSTGDAMIVWGGFDSGNNPLGDGGIYTP